MHKYILRLVLDGVLFGCRTLIVELSETEQRLQSLVQENRMAITKANAEISISFFFLNIWDQLYKTLNYLFKSQFYSYIMINSKILECDWSILSLILINFSSTFLYNRSLVLRELNVTSLCWKFIYYSFQSKLQYSVLKNLFKILVVLDTITLVYPTLLVLNQLAEVKGKIFRRENITDLCKVERN